MTTSNIVPMHPQRRRLAEVGLAGLLLGALMGRPHHPLVWAALVAGVLGTLALMAALWPYVLGAGVLLTVAHARRRGHTWGAIATRGAFVLGALVVVGLGLLAGIGPALLAGAGIFATWRIVGRRPEERMTERQWHESERGEGFANRGAGASPAPRRKTCDGRRRCPNRAAR